MRQKGSSMEAVIQVRNDGRSIDQGGSSGDGEMWLDSGYILKPIGFADGSDVRWGEGVKDDSKVYGKDGVVIYWALEELPWERKLRAQFWTQSPKSTEICFFKHIFAGNE